jgi:hypothetical protein
VVQPVKRFWQASAELGEEVTGLAAGRSIAGRIWGSGWAARTSLGGGGSEYRVEHVGVLGVPVCDQELQAAGPLGLIYERVPGLLGCPGGGGVGSDAGEVDPATVMLDDEQHLKPAEKDGAGMGEGRPRRSSWPGRTGTASS